MAAALARLVKAMIVTADARFIHPPRRRSVLVGRLLMTTAVVLGILAWVLAGARVADPKAGSDPNLFDGPSLIRQP